MLDKVMRSFVKGITDNSVQKESMNFGCNNEISYKHQIHR